jgi:hypothetical protein
VEAYNRKQKKGSSTRAPRNADEFMPQFYALFERFVETQEQILDIQRAVAGLPARVSRAEVQRAAFSWRVELTELAPTDEDEPEGENQEDGPGAGGAAGGGE